MAESDAKILVVEDEKDVLDLIRNILQSRGYPSDEAGDGAEAIRRLEERPYDLVLTDWTMPRRNGLDVLIRAKELWEDIVVIILTGNASLESTIQSLKKGANDYIRKPFGVDELLNTIDVHLHRQYLQRENKRLQRQTEKDRIKLHKKVAELNILHRLSVELTYEFDFSHIFSLINEALVLAIPFDVCASLDLNKNRVNIHSMVPVDADIVRWVRGRLVEFLRESGVRVYDERLSIEHKQYGDGAPLHEIPRTVEFIIMADESTTYGAIMVAKKGDEPFSDEDSGFLHDVARQVSEVFGRLKGVMESQRGKLQFIVDNLPDGIIVYEQRDDAVILNPMARRMIDRRASRAITKKDVECRLNIKFDDLIDEVGRAAYPVIRQISLDNGPSISILDAHVAHLAMPDGLPSGLIMIFRDVTRERTLEQMKKEFISNVHHELRTPAAIIKEFLGLLHDQIGGPLNVKQLEYISTMQRNMERLLRLIENLLFSSRMDVDQIRLAKKMTDVLAIAQTVSREFLVRLAQRGIALRTRFPGSKVEAEVDSDALIQILSNLLDNAMKFSPKGSTVNMELHGEQDAIVFSVSDEGRGIAPEHMDKIFERFYRIESSDEARREGVGLGLPIVRDLVTRHNGMVWAESRVNEGSTFFVRIPVSSDAGGN